MAHILMIEAEDDFLWEIIAFFANKTRCQITNLSQDVRFSNTLIFPHLEIHLKEQVVYNNHTLIPMSRYEFLVLT